MGLESRYERIREERWSLRVRKGEWSRKLWAEVAPRLDLAGWSDHPQTWRLSCAEGEGEYYLKVYRRFSVFAFFKDLFRASKAFRALKQGEALSELDFHVPAAMAAGEKRRFRRLEIAFLLTREIPGVSLPFFLRGIATGVNRVSVGKKRAFIQQLALEIRRMHKAGFVHGDLVPSNILVCVEAERVSFYFIDHDRTRRYPSWLPQRLWRRNLVQLNRFVLPGISLQDRVRFLRFYLGCGRLGKKERRLARWLEAKTRKRRRECDRVDGRRVSFRELMRWNGPFAAKTPRAQR